VAFKLSTVGTAVAVLVSVGGMGVNVSVGGAGVNVNASRVGVSGWTNSSVTGADAGVGVEAILQEMEAKIRIVRNFKNFVNFLSFIGSFRSSTAEGTVELYIIIFPIP
jgi:hypothetical protein